MSEPVRLEIIVDDHGTPALEAFGTALGHLGPSATAAEAAIGGLGTSLEAQKTALTDSVLYWEKFDQAQVDSAATEEKTAVALGQVQAALATFTTRAAAAGDDVGKLQSALTQGESAFARLAVTAQGATPALEKFGTELATERARLNALADAETQATAVAKLHAEQMSLNATAAKFLGEATTTATTATSSWGTSLLQTTAMVTGIYSGAMLLATGIKDAVGAIGDFDTAMRQAYTQGIKTTEQQESLRTSILALPPALGTAAELAKGLYEALSAGIEPAKAVEFVGVAAELAKAGLSNLDTATIALIKTMTAYKIPVEQASDVSQVLFKTVQYGMGHLEDFAKAFPEIVQQSAALGISLTDTAAVLAALSLAFKSPEAAATGYRGFLQELIQNFDKFAAAGINVKEILAESGITGLLRKLQELTHGNAVEMHEFVPEIRAGQAALAAMGPEYEKIVELAQKFKDKANVTKDAAKLMADGMQGSWTELKTSTTNLMNELAPLFLVPATATAKGLTGITQDIKTFVQDPMKQLEKGFEGAGLMLGVLASELKRADDAFEGTGAAVEDLGQGTGEWRDESERAADTQQHITVELTRTRTEAEKSAEEWARLQKFLRDYQVAGEDTIPTFEKVRDAAGALDEGLKKLGSKEIMPTETIERYVSQMIKSLELLAHSPDVSFLELQHAADRSLKVIEGRFVSMPSKIQDVFARIAEKQVHSLQEMAVSGALSFGEVANKAEKMEQDLKKIFGKVPDDLNAELAKLRTVNFAGLVDAKDILKISFDGAALETGLQRSTDAVKRFHTEVQADGSSIVTNISGWATTADDTGTKMRNSFGSTAKDISGAFAKYHLETRAEFQEDARSLGVQFGILLHSGQATADGLKAAFDKWAAAINKGEFTDVSNEFIDDMGKMNSQAELFGTTQSHVFKDLAGNIKTVTNAQLGLQDQTTDYLQAIAQKVAIANKTLLDGGKQTASEYAANWKKTTDEINKADFKELTPTMLKTLEDINAKASTMVGGFAANYKVAVRDVRGTVEELTLSAATSMARTGELSKKDAETFASNWVRGFEKMVDSGQYSEGQLKATFDQFAAFLKLVFGDDIPAEYQAMLDKFVTTTGTKGKETGNAFKRGFVKEVEGGIDDIISYWNKEEKKLGSISWKETIKPETDDTIADLERKKLSTLDAIKLAGQLGPHPTTEATRIANKEIADLRKTLAEIEAEILKLRTTDDTITPVKTTTDTTTTSTTKDTTTGTTTSSTHTAANAGGGGGATGGGKDVLGGGGTKKRYGITIDGIDYTVIAEGSDHYIIVVPFGDKVPTGAVVAYPKYISPATGDGGTYYLVKKPVDIAWVDITTGSGTAGGNPGAGSSGTTTTVKTGSSSTGGSTAPSTLGGTGPTSKKVETSTVQKSTSGGGDTHVHIYTTLPPTTSRADAQSFVTSITPAINEAIKRKQIKID